jgi:hypothetical protein
MPSIPPHLKMGTIKIPPFSGGFEDF